MTPTSFPDLLFILTLVLAVGGVASILACAAFVIGVIGGPISFFYGVGRADQKAHWALSLAVVPTGIIFSGKIFSASNPPESVYLALYSTVLLEFALATYLVIALNNIRAFACFAGLVGISSTYLLANWAAISFNSAM